MSFEHLFTSESVTEGHPDKVADQVSDAILDACLAQDPASRVACETLVTTGLALIAGEITTEAYVDMPRIVRETIETIGYTDSGMGFDHRTCAVLTSIDEQSRNISVGVTAGEGLYAAQGAGDQGLMFGFAVRETDELMPLPITLAHRLTQRLALVRKEGTLGYLRPDGKSQVTVRYDGLTPIGIDTVVLSTQHEEDVDHKDLKTDMIEHVIRPILPDSLAGESTVQYLVNPTGIFVEGGPKADCGLTGRKIIVDTYGGMGRHGGGALSGKDPSKVDRSACYAARHVAKNLVAADLADRCEVQLAYAIGVAEPVSVRVDSFGTGKIDDAELTSIVRKVFDLTPAGIIGGLGLLQPMYLRTASYGHFGRPEENFPWEETAETSERVREAASSQVS